MLNNFTLSPRERESQTESVPLDESDSRRANANHFSHEKSWATGQRDPKYRKIDLNHPVLKPAK